MGGISVMLLIGMLSAMYVFFIAVIAVLIIYFAVINICSVKLQGIRL